MKHITKIVKTVLAGTLFTGTLFTGTLLTSTLLLLISINTQALELDTPAPDFTLKSNQDSNIRLSDLAGNVVMVNFWATWCGPCRQEMPLLEKLYQKYNKAGFVILGVNVEDDASKAESYLVGKDLNFPILFDTENTVSKLYDVKAMPSTVFVDRNGNFRYLHKGFKLGEEKNYDKIIRALLRQ